MRDEIFFDKIEAYLRGKMPAAEVEVFEKEIAADPALAALVKTHRLENQALEWLVERDLLSKMNAWEREVSGSSSRVARYTLRVRRVWWAAGVAATLAVAFFGWWLLRPQGDIGGLPPFVAAPKSKPPAAVSPKTTPKPSQKPPVSQPQEAEKNEDVAESSKPSPAPTVKPPAPTAPSTPAIDYSALAANYYKQGDFIQDSKNATGGDTGGYGQALDSYKSKEFGNVEKLLEPTLKSNPNALKEKELLAHSLYQNRRYDEAIPYFRDLSSAKDKALAERSEWALSLTLLHKMPAQKALLSRVLDKILANPSHTFYAKAKELKGKLGN